MYLLFKMQHTNFKNIFAEKRSSYFIQREHFQVRESKAQILGYNSEERMMMCDCFFGSLTVYIGIVVGAAAALLIITLVSCFCCSCCFLYKKRHPSSSKKLQGEA